jgi:drug/metabolite transporter (DMT)-like permease
LTKSQELTGKSLLIAITLAIVCHLSWGAYPAITKKLLMLLPPFSLITVGYALVLLLMFPKVVKYPWSKSLSNRSAWLLMIVGAGRMITNILSIKATHVAYVQLVNLLTPFLVALVGRAFFREPIPPYTFSALTISTIGSILVILQGPSLAIFQNDWQISDTIGVIITFISAIFLAFFMLMTRYEQATRQIDSMVVFAQQCVVLMVTALIASICLREDWHKWLKMSQEMWIFFACFLVINLIAGNLLQIHILGKLGAALFTSLMGARLVAALTLSAIILSEPLKSWWQVFGALIVIITVMVYMLIQTRTPVKNIS